MWTVRKKPEDSEIAQNPSEEIVSTPEFNAGIPLT